MSDLVVGLGVALVAEGLLWALAPHLGVKILHAAAMTPAERLRASGWVAVAAGAFLVWLVRG